MCPIRGSHAPAQREENVPAALTDIQAALKYDPEMKRDTTKRASVTLSLLQKSMQANKK